MKNFVLREVKSSLIECELESIGFDSSYLRCAAEKFKYKNIKIYDLSVAQANILKQTALIFGADCAVNRNVITGNIEKSDVILCGSNSQLRKIASKLKGQPFKLGILGGEINDFLEDKSRKTKLVGILNITPDSFSDGGKYNDIENFKNIFEIWEKEFVNIIDIGAESTRPSAKTLTYNEELDRLDLVFKYLKTKKFSYFKPKLSIDTYHYETAKKAIENGFDIINDVNALKDERMIELIKDNKNIKYILTHSLMIPPKKEIIIKDIDDIKRWFEDKIELLEKNNINKNQIIFDPGIGFGKTPSQTLKLIQNITEFQKYGFKLLFGHSRKSFMKIFNNDIETRDFETLALSLGLSNKVDILRVHTPIEHQNALLAYKSIDNQFI